MNEEAAKRITAPYCSQIWRNSTGHEMLIKSRPGRSRVVFTLPIGYVFKRQLQAIPKIRRGYFQYVEGRYDSSTDEAFKRRIVRDMIHMDTRYLAWELEKRSHWIVAFLFVSALLWAAWQVGR